MPGSLTCPQNCRHTYTPDNCHPRSCLRSSRNQMIRSPVSLDGYSSSCRPQRLLPKPSHLSIASRSRPLSEPAMPGSLTCPQNCRHTYTPDNCHPRSCLRSSRNQMIRSPVSLDGYSSSCRPQRLLPKPSHLSIASRSRPLSEPAMPGSLTCPQNCRHTYTPDNCHPRSCLRSSRNQMIRSPVSLDGYSSSCRPQRLLPKPSHLSIASRSRPLSEPAMPGSLTCPQNCRHTYTPDNCHPRSCLRSSRNQMIRSPVSLDGYSSSCRPQRLLPKPSHLSIASRSRPLSEPAMPGSLTCPQNCRHTYTPDNCHPRSCLRSSRNQMIRSPVSLDGYSSSCRLLSLLPPPRSTLFPYPSLFRSEPAMPGSLTCPQNCRH